MLVVLFVPTFGVRAMPIAWRAPLGALGSASLVRVIVGVPGVVVAVDAVVLHAAITRFPATAPSLLVPRQLEIADGHVGWPPDG